MASLLILAPVLVVLWAARFVQGRSVAGYLLPGTIVIAVSISLGEIGARSLGFPGYLAYSLSVIVTGGTFFLVIMYETVRRRFRRT